MRNIFLIGKVFREKCEIIKEVANGGYLGQRKNGKVLN